MDRPRLTSDSKGSAPVALRMRADLTAVKRATRGGYRWLVKDPISLRYFELSDEEYAVLTMLDGTLTLTQLKEAIEKRFPPRLATHEQLQALLHRFYELGLAFGHSLKQNAAAETARRSHAQYRWLSQLVNPLFIKLPGFDPEPLLRWFYPRVRWVFGPVPLLVCLALIATAAIVAAVEWDSMRSELPSIGQLFQAGNLVWLMAALAVSKTLHELGHAVTCKHYGGECHEIGPALLVFTPSLYCDTTDAWMIPGKWQRAAVGAAGMAVELVLAAVCVLVWRFSAPGVIHFLALNMVLVCTISTLVFNGNPLLRFDGYYILSDVLEIPNLWQTSRAALLRLLQVGMLGLPGQSIPKAPHNPVLLLGYAIASLIYRWVIVLGIVVLLAKALRPYGLQAVGNALLVLTLLGMFVVPGWRTLQFFRRPGVWRRVRLARSLASCVLVILLIAAVLYVPIPHHVSAPFVLEQRDAQKVYVTVPGILETVYAKPGERVDVGSPIVKLTNLEVTREISRLSGEHERLQIHLQNLTRRQGHDRDAADAIPAARTALMDLDERLRRRRLDAQRLQLVAHQAGVLSPPPHVPPPPAVEEELPTWSGLPCDPYNLGCYLEVGTLVGLVGEPGAMDALLIIDQSDIEFVRPGQSAAVKLNEYRSRTLGGTIAQVAQIDLDKVPLVLSHKLGGELSTVTDKSGRERPLRVAYQARVPLPAAEFPLLPGFHGRAKIDVGSEPLGRRLMRLVRQTFLF